MADVESDYDRMFRVDFGSDDDPDPGGPAPSSPEDRVGPLTARKAVVLVQKRIY